MFNDTQANQNQTTSIRYMTSLGVFIQSTAQHENGDKIVLNSFLKDGKAKWKENNYQGKKTNTLGFSSADQSAYVYLSEDYVRQFIKKGLMLKSDDGQFLQLDAKILVSPKVASSTKASLKDLGL